MLRTSTAALCSSANLQPGVGVSTSITSSPSPRPLSRRSILGGRKRHFPRQYATVRRGDPTQDDVKSDDGPGLCWPASKNPTPYEIFSLEKGAPYRKARYYELVKLYHPDRNQHTSCYGIPHTTKLERYRLVVAAHSILCDPARRRAYDLYGAGWAGQADARNMYREAERAWRQEPGNASNNATWEDWERWYRNRDGEKQETQFMSNGAFITAVGLFALAGAWGQATRAGNRSMSVAELWDHQNDVVSRDMQQRQSQSAPLSRDGRIDAFLRQREGWGYSTGHLPEDSVKK